MEMTIMLTLSTKEVIGSERDVNGNFIGLLGGKS
jgi:hypothetical protein